MLGASGEIYILYFLIVVFFGSFYLLNLVLAVVFISYEQEVMAPQKEEVMIYQFVNTWTIVLQFILVTSLFAETGPT